MCAPGYWCRKGSPVPNPTVHMPSTNLTEFMYGPCPPGFHCPNATVNPVPCRNHTFKPNWGGVGQESDCRPCPAGQQCFEGKVSFF